MAKTKPAFSYDDVVRFGWVNMKRNYPFFLMLFLLNAALIIARWDINTKLVHTDMALSLLTFLGFFIVNALLGLGTVHTMLLIAKGKKPQFQDLFTHSHLLGNYIIAHILMMVIVVGGLLLFIVPGIMWAIQFGFYPYVIVEKKMGPLEALKKSKHLTRGNLWRLFFLHVVLGAINMLGALLLFVGLFVTIPTTMIATAYVYKKLSAK